MYRLETYCNCYCCIYIHSVVQEQNTPKKANAVCVKKQVEMTVGNTAWIVDCLTYSVI